MTKIITAEVPLVGLSLGTASIKITTNGFVGEACKDATKQFQDALGVVLDDQETQEMYETEEGVERLREGG